MHILYLLLLLLLRLLLRLLLVQNELQMVYAWQEDCLGQAGWTL